MKPLLTKVSLVANISLLSFLTLAAPVVPGEFTDPSNMRKAVEQEAQFETPEDFRFPYISTYYVESTITTKDNVEIDFFVTDWDNSLARFGDDSFRFDVYFECITPDGKTLKKTLKSIKAGDNKFAFKPFYISSNHVNYPKKVKLLDYIFSHNLRWFFHYAQDKLLDFHQFQTVF